MADNILSSGKAIEYLNRLYGIKVSYVTLRNWVLAGRGDVVLKAKTKRNDDGRSTGYTFTQHDLSVFVKAVGKDILKSLKRGRPVTV